MKILYIITKSNFGGAQKYVYELATTYKETGHTVSVAFGGNGALNQKLKDAGVKTISIDGAQRDMSFGKDLKTLWSLFKIIKSEKPDVIHLNSPKAGGLGAFIGRILFVPTIIYTSHGWTFKEPRPAWQTFFIALFSWLIAVLSHKVIVLSERERFFVRNWPFVQKKFNIIPNGVAPFTPLNKQEALRQIIGLDRAMEFEQRNSRILGTIAELHRNKGLEYAVLGLQQYYEQVGYMPNDTRLLIIGEGEERAKLEALIKETKLEDSIILIGHKEDARQYVKAFDFFILPSVKEGMPYALLEAAYANVPVIASHVGGIPNIIEDLVTGMIINPGRPNDIKNALVYLDEHPGIERQFASKLKKVIDEKFNFDLMIESLKKIYDKSKTKLKN